VDPAAEPEDLHQVLHRRWLGRGVNLGAFTLLLALDVNKYLARRSHRLSIVWNFFLNNYWTFRWRKNHTGSASAP